MTSFTYAHHPFQPIPLIKVPYNDEGLEAIIFTADGDMRQALNNLQATFAGFAFINAENVFKVSGHCSFDAGHCWLNVLHLYWYKRCVINHIHWLSRRWSKRSLKETLMKHICSWILYGRMAIRQQTSLLPYLRWWKIIQWKNFWSWNLSRSAQMWHLLVSMHTDPVNWCFTGNQHYTWKDCEWIAISPTAVWASCKAVQATLWCSH